VTRAVQAEVANYQTVLDQIGQGVCFFGRLILSNQGPIPVGGQTSNIGSSRLYVR